MFLQEKEKGATQFLKLHNSLHTNCKIKISTSETWGETTPGMVFLTPYVDGFDEAG